MLEVSLVDGHIDNTMTDEDIIKGVDKCASIGESCEGCPFYDYTDCDKRLKEKFHSLINRKNAEIEKLKSYNKFLAKIIGEQEIELATAKPEAIKEFAERLKSKMIITHKSKEGYCVYEFDDDLIDNLVKEMTESK